jgi:hypothetical protein
MPDKFKKAEKIVKSVHTVTDPITTPIKKVQKSFLRLLPKFILYPLELIILLLIVSFFFIQTNTFNRWALNIALSKLNDSWKEKEISVYAETLKGNILIGFRLMNAGIKVKSDTLIRFDTLLFRYDVFGLLRDNIKLRMVSLINPKLNISKLTDKRGNILWNFDYLLQSEKKEEDTIKKPFTWGIDVEDLQIQNGNFRILDSNISNSSLSSVKLKNTKGFEPGNLSITNFYLSLSAMYYPDFKSVNIKNLAFKTNSDFALNEFSIDAVVSPKDSLSEIKNVKILTPNSDISIPLVTITHLDPFSGVNYYSFNNKDIKIELSAKKFNTKDLVYFLPYLNFMNGVVSLDLNAEGKYGDINIKKFIFKSDNSSINITGKVKNLHDPAKLSFDITSKDDVMDPVDAKNLLPGIPIPDYSRIGKVFGNITYVGEPLNFSTDFDVRSVFGNAKGSFALNLTTPDYSYKTEFLTNNLNIGGILNNKDLESSLNLKADITGRGFDINKISAKANYELAGSHFNNFNINKSAGVLEVSSKNITAELSLLTDELETNLKGKMNLDKPDDAEYTMKGNAHNLDLSKFTKRPFDRSNLNFAFDISGKGATLENISGSYNFNFQNSFYSSYYIPATPVDIKMSKSKSNADLTVNTGFFDLKAKGSFDLKDIVDATSYHINYLTNEIKKKFMYDSTVNYYSSSATNKDFHDFNFEYEFITKDIKPLTKLFDSTGIKFQGGFKGKMENTASKFSSSTEWNISNFNYLDSLFALKNVKGNIEYKFDYKESELKPFDDLYPIYTDVNLKGDKVRFSTTSFDSLSLKLNLSKSEQSFSLRGGQDSTFIVDFSGTSTLFNWLHLTFDTLYIKYNKFLISNDGKLDVVYKPGFSEKTISFRQFNINNNLVNFNLAGDLSFAGKSNLNVEAKVNKVGALLDLLQPSDTTNGYVHKSPVKGSIRRLSIHYEGTKENPIVNLEMNSGLLRYENSTIGRIDAFIDYDSSLLTTDILLSNAQGNGKLRVNGEIPLINPVMRGDERTNASISDNPLNFKLSTDNFQLNFFSKLIPNLADIRGLLNGEINATGTVSDPKLNGVLDVTKGRFLLAATGLYHRFNAKLRTENNTLVVDNFRILNLEDNGRHIDFWGRVNFDGLNVKDIDLSSSGDIVVLDESALENDFGMTGNMVVGSGDPPVRIHGDLQKLYIDGQLLIKDANIKFSSIPTSPYDISSDNFIYKMMKDTTYPGFKDTVIIVPPEKFSQVDPFLREFIVASSEPKKKTETNIIYNLQIKTWKNAVVSILFNPLTSEELYGEMQADIDLNNNIGQMQLNGVVDIVGDSYYRFYRNFKVKDSKLTFRGVPNNPELNIQAVYELKTGNSNTFLSSETQGTSIILEIKGTKLKPDLTLTLNENGVERTGSDAQADAISYLIFGVSQKQLSAGQQSALARNVGVTTGTSVVSGMLGAALRNIAPFILNTELNYSEGNIATGTDVRITSAIGDAVVKVGGKIFSGVENTEINVEYPLNKILNMDISNNLVLELSRTIDENSLIGGRSVYTGVKLSYKIRY